MIIIKILIIKIMKIYLKHARRASMAINAVARATAGARVFSKYNLNKILYPATLGLVSRTLGIRGIPNPRDKRYPEPSGMVSRTLGNIFPNPRDWYPEPSG